MKNFSCQTTYFSTNHFYKRYRMDNGWDCWGCSYPEYRRNGYVKTLIMDALKHMRNNNQIVSLLHPFDISFYRKYGWEILDEQKKLTIEKINLKFLEAQPGSDRRYSKETHSEVIENIYINSALRHSRMLKRDNKMVERKCI